MQRQLGSEGGVRRVRGVAYKLITVVYSYVYNLERSSQCSGSSVNVEFMFVTLTSTVAMSQAT